MDNNMVNIDDLVRQRLLGREEPERAGAWLRMSELLEKEMPKERAVGFFWRRIFGAMGVMLLIGAVGLGGYKMNAFRNLSGTTDATPVANSTAAKTIAASTIPATNPANAGDSNEPKNDKTTTTAAAANGETKKPADHKKAVAANQKHINKTGTNIPHQKSTENTDNKTTHSTAAAVIAPVSNNNGAKKTEPKHTANDETASTTGTVAPTTGTAVKGERKHLTSAKVTTDNNNKTGQTHRTDNPGATTGVALSETDASKSDVTTGGTEHETPSATTSKTEKAVAKTGNKPAGRVHATKGATKTAGKTGTAKSGTDLTVISSSTPTGNTSAGTESSVAAKDVATKEPAQKSMTPGATKSSAGTSKTSNGISAKTLASSAGANKKIARVTGGKKPTGDKAGISDKDMKELSLINTKKGKRVIEKMVVFQRYIKNGQRDANSHLDTISIESITEEYETVNARKVSAIRNGEEIAASTDQNTDSSPIKPGSSSESMSMAAKEAAGKQSKGAMALEGLHAAFNDIKYHAGHPTFAAGVTAGGNATFFGPNSFKGFQFGVTGQLSFNDALSVMGEIKYFQRINGNYSLNDNYYTYTPVSGGYNRQLVMNPYSISTLHSVEMPVTVRLAEGKFNFFAGVNLAYLFSINTGDYPLAVQNNTPVIVATPGNDNSPKIQANDFNARFGLGYIFGASCQISPKVSLDLRDVQTFWDNASTTGSKYISSQLYKSPSFQLSLGYRLGGNKNKDK